MIHIMLDPYKLRFSKQSLHKLVFKGEYDTVREWLSIGGDPNIRDTNGQTLLHAAVHGRHSEMVKELLAHGADANACSNEFPYHTYPAQIAAYNGSLDILDLLIRHGADLTVETENGCTLIHLAVINDEVAVIQYLLDHEADIDIPAESGTTPLSSATMHGFREATQLLLQAGANPNAEYACGLTPLSQVSDPEIARMLLEHGAEVNHVGTNGATPIFHVRSLKAFEVLLAHGAKIDIVDNKGNTLLHQAAEEIILSDYDEAEECNIVRLLAEDMRIAELFIAQGLDINTRNLAGQTPLGVALENENGEMVAYLRAHGGSV
jgi:ankyrin repeat protein